MTSIRTEVNAQSLNTIHYVITSNKDDLSLKATGSYSGSNSLMNKVQATKVFKDPTKTISITPRYNLEIEEGDIIVNYKQDKAEFEIIASKTLQQITLSQQLNSNNRVGTTLTNYGDISVEWEHCYDGKIVTSCLKPNESLDVSWKDGGWVADFNLPMDGILDVKGLNVSIKKQVTF